MPQLHGLDLGFVLALGTQTAFQRLDVSRFTRLQKLQLRYHNPGRARELGWGLGLPASLRVLDLNGLVAPCFMVNPNVTRTLSTVFCLARTSRLELGNRRLLIVLPFHGTLSHHLAHKWFR